MTIPYAPEYIQALRGVISELGKVYTWQQTIGESSAPAIEAAEIWRAAAQSITYSDECEDDVSCLDIADCIENDAAVQAAIDGRVISSPSVKEAEAISIQASPLPLAQRQENVLKTGECGEDFLFNQISVFVSLLDTLSVDIFEAIEAGTNPLERAELALSSIPVLETLPIDELFTFANELISNVQEDYQSSYNAAFYDDLRCELFCEFRDTCELSLEQAFEFYIQKTGKAFGGDPLQSFLDGINFFITGQFPSQLSVYGMHTIIIALMRLSQNVFGVNFARLALRIKAAGDTADNDWQILCEDCSPLECLDFKASKQGWEAEFFGPNAQARYVAGQGWGVMEAGTPFQGRLLIGEAGGYSEKITLITIALKDPLAANQQFSISNGLGAQNMQMFAGENSKSFAVTVAPTGTLLLSANGIDPSVSLNMGMILERLCFVFE